MASRGFNPAVTRNRQHYLRLLRESAREATIESSDNKNNGKYSMLNRIRSHESNLNLPDNWIKTCNIRLQKSFKNIIPKEKIIKNSDLFICALIHPSYVSSRSTRAAVAMPIELTLTGSSTIRLLKEVLNIHNKIDILQSKNIATIPQHLDVEDLLLYDAEICNNNNNNNNLPEEVKLAAATALCGAVTLSQGLQFATGWLEKIILK